MSEWTHWFYERDDDYELLRSWAEAHQANVTPPEWLPSTGFILCKRDPVMLLFLYHDPSSQVALLDNLHTHPKASISTIKEGIIYAVNGPLKEEARNRGFSVLMARTLMAIARTLLHTPRWYVLEKELMAMTYMYQNEELQNEVV
jgi:hypothetical protein